MRPLVSRDDFTLAAERAIFEAACRLEDEGKPADVVTILEDARKHGADVSDRYAAELLQITPTAAHAEAYARQVHEEAVRRRLASVGETLLEDAQDPQKTTAGVIAATMQALENADTAPQTAMLSTSDALSGFLDYRERLDAGQAVTVSTGYPGLDKLLGGGMLH